MLFFIAAWSLLIIVCLPTGYFILNLSHSDSLDRIGDRFIISLWLGVVAIGILMLIASFFSPLTPLTAAIVVSGVVVISILSARVRAELAKGLSSISPLHICIYFAVLFVVAAFMVQPVDSTDAAMYHIQTVKWLSRFGSVPGVALIYGRLGFTSSWFALAAPFHVEDFDARSTAIMGGLGMCWMLLHGAILASRFITFNVDYEDWFITVAYLICLPYTLGLNSAVSSSPDLPVMYLVIIVAWVILILAKRETRRYLGSSANARLIPLILSAGAVAIKLNAAPLLIVSLIFYLFGEGAFFQKVKIVFLIGILMVVPILISGLITSGCALYPAPFLCFDLPWSVGTELAGKMNTTNQNYERWMQYTPPENINWVIPWANRNLDSGLLIISLLLTTISAFIAKEFKLVAGRFWVLAIGITGVIFVLCTVPTRRFLLGYLTISPSLIAPIYPRVVLPLTVIVPLALESDWQTRRIRFILLLISLFVYIYILFARKGLFVRFAPAGFIVLATLLSLKVLLAAAGLNMLRNGRSMSYWLTPPAVKKTELEIWIDRQVNDFKYIQTMRPYPDGRCWAAELPCTPWLLHENIRLRDPKKGLGAGVVRAD